MGPLLSFSGHLNHGADSIFLFMPYIVVAQFIGHQPKPDKSGNYNEEKNRIGPSNKKACLITGRQ